MLRQMHNSTATIRLRFTTSEMLLLVAAVGLLCASILQLVVAPLGSGAMVLAAAAIIALVHERSSTRLAVRLLSERFTNSSTLDKLEVVDTGNVAALEHALNRIIQQARAHSETSRRPSVPVAVEPDPATSRMAAVLSVGIRADMADPFAGLHVERILRSCALARYVVEGAAAVSIESDGTVVVACGALTAQPISVSMRQALEIAQALAAERALRFGLSCGPVRLLSAPGLAPIVLGAPCAEANRLARMAVSWHEYDLLAAEPVALLARAFHSHRTTLTLTHRGAPASPVYTLDLVGEQSVALSA